MAAGNPAGRLHIVFSKLGTRSEKLKLADVLQSLSTPAPAEDEEGRSLSEPDLMRVYGSLLGLPAETLELIDRLPEDTEDLEHLREPVVDIEKALRACGLNSTAKAYGQRMQPDTVSGLRHVQAALNRNGYRETQVPKDKLAELHHHVSELFEDVRTSAIDDELRRFMLRHLDNIERGIRHYQVEGVPPLQDAIDLFIGDLARDAGEDDRRGVRRFLADDGLGRRLLRLIGEVNGVIEFAKLGTALGTALGLELSSGL